MACEALIHLPENHVSVSIPLVPGPSRSMKGLNFKLACHSFMGASRRQHSWIRAKDSLLQQEQWSEYLIFLQILQVPVPKRARDAMGCVVGEEPWVERTQIFYNGQCICLSVALKGDTSRIPRLLVLQTFLKSWFRIVPLLMRHAEI